MKNYPNNTVAGICLNNSQNHAEKNYLMSRYDKLGRRTNEIHSYTWKEAIKVIREVAQGLYAMGFREFDRSAVFAPNRPRWIFASIAPMLMRGAMVPIYPTSKTEDIWWILYDSGAKFCFCGSKQHLDEVLSVKDRLETLEKVIMMDPIEEKPDDIVMSFEELLELGRQHQDKEAEIDKLVNSGEGEDMVTLMYTSGTTGRPKGVMLANSNLLSQITVVKEMGFRQDDLWMAHLPMCHSYGLSADLLGGSYVPGTLGILDSLDTDEIRWGLQTFQPTVMNSVPRLWEKMYLRIQSLLKERPKPIQNFFKWGTEIGSQIYQMENKNQKVPASLRYKHALCQPLFNLVKKKAGLNRLRFCSTGGGPINPELIKFFGGLGIHIYQGYGLTETSPVINANTLTYNKIGTVGKPLAGVEEKIDEDGEVLVRGPQVMKGYWNNPEANAESFTEDGFYRTGDVGYFDEDGYLVITDRKKELLKTSGGKYVAPQPIENEFKTDPYVEQVAVVGESRNYISALVVPEFETLKEWAEEKGIKFKDNNELVQNPEVIKLIQERIDLVNAKLARHEQIKKYKIIDKPFTEETGELTPTQKLKRRIVEDKYKDLIDEMYTSE